VWYPPVGGNWRGMPTMPPLLRGWPGNFFGPDSSSWPSPSSEIAAARNVHALLLLGLDPTVVPSAAKSIPSRFCDERRPDFLQNASFVKSNDTAARHPLALINELMSGSTGKMSKVSPRGRRPAVELRASWVFLPNGD